MEAPPRYRTSGPPQSRIVCGGCRVLLLYPQGAQNVRCARCSYVTIVPPPANDATAQLTCCNLRCRVTLVYPRGASQVQCSLCGTLNDATRANNVGQVVCGRCHVMLEYAFGANAVKCALCRHVTPVTARGARPDAAQGALPVLAAVLVHNPPTLDEQGREVECLALGIRI